MLMLYRFMLAGLILFCVCFGLVSAARAAGASGPLPETMRWFTHPDGRVCEELCLLGITKDTLKAEYVLTAMRTHPATRNLPMKSDGIIYQLVAHDHRIELIRIGPGRDVGVLRLLSNSPGQGLSLGWLIAFFGVPEKYIIRLHPPLNPAELELLYPTKSIGIGSIVTGHVLPTDLICGVFVSTPEGFKFENVGDYDTAKAWDGFKHRIP